MIGASYTGCSGPNTVALLSVGVGLMGATMSAYRINHLDISPRYAGVLMAITNCVANIFALLAPLIAGQITHNRVSRASPFAARGRSQQAAGRGLVDGIPNTPVSLMPR